MIRKTFARSLKSTGWRLHWWKDWTSQALRGSNARGCDFCCVLVFALRSLWRWRTIKKRLGRKRFAKSQAALQNEAKDFVRPIDPVLPHRISTGVVNVLPSSQTVPPKKDSANTESARNYWYIYICLRIYMYVYIYMYIVIFFIFSHSMSFTLVESTSQSCKELMAMNGMTRYYWHDSNSVLMCIVFSLSSTAVRLAASTWNSRKHLRQGKMRRGSTSTSTICWTCKVRAKKHCCNIFRIVNVVKYFSDTANSTVVGDDRLDVDSVASKAGSIAVQALP